MLESEFSFYFSFNSARLCSHCIPGRRFPHGEPRCQRPQLTFCQLGIPSLVCRQALLRFSICTDSSHVPVLDQSRERAGPSSGLPWRIPLSQDGALFEPFGLGVVRGRGSPKGNEGAVGTRGEMDVRRVCETGAGWRRKSPTKQISDPALWALVSGL